ncbi:hypothetical protein [Glaciecola sp. 1036]|uniref:hypothetical protein n=1 Tax=Alteromonadaceae TaxID=72275 RepID=UPI003CFE5B0E
MLHPEPISIIKIQSLTFADREKIGELYLQLNTLKQLIAQIDDFSLLEPLGVSLLLESVCQELRSIAEPELKKPQPG